MASASRSLRAPNRTSSPLVHQFSPPNHQLNDASPTGPQFSGERWMEPPVRKVPSWQDHKGMEPYGVLSEMRALGSFPTSKDRQRARQDPTLRRTLQSRQLGALGVDEARSTPESILPSENTRASSIRQDEQYQENMPSTTVEDTPEIAIDPALMVDYQPETVTDPTPAPSPPKATPISRPNTAQIPSAPLHSPIHISYNNAARISPHLKPQLYHLLTAAQSDPHFFALLQDKYANGLTPQGEKAFDKKVKRLKRTYHSQNPTPVSNHYSSGLSDSAAGGSSMLKSPPQVPQANSTSNLPKNAHHSRNIFIEASPSPQNPSPLRSSTNVEQMRSRSDSRLTPTSEPINAPSEMRSEKPDSPSRRDSSSSLSSVNEEIVREGPPPALELPNTSGKSRRRAVQDAADAIKEAETDLEREETQKKLRLNLSHDVVPKASRIRRPLTGSLKAQSTPQNSIDFKTKNLKRDHALMANESLPSGPETRSSRQGTPAGVPSALGRPPKRQKTTARVKLSPVKNKRAAVIAGVARPERGTRVAGSVGFDDNSELSDNNDYCSACSGQGYLLCCDGCDRSFHFTCLDPPIDSSKPLDSSWFCYICQSNQEPPEDEMQSRGLFNELSELIKKTNSTSFNLPLSIRDYFEGVSTGKDGEYVESHPAPQRATRSHGRQTLDEVPDQQKLRDARGNAVLCFSCSKSALEHRDIITCDYCGLHWHLDCLSPPLANAPNRAINGKRPSWMCPNHIEHDLRHLDPVERDGVRHEPLGRTHRVRRPKHATIKDTSLRRGFKNNGLIEIESDSEEWEEEEDKNGIIIRVPTTGIKLDFIDKVKTNRRTEMEKVYRQSIELHLQAEQLKADTYRRLSEKMDRQAFADRKTALNLVQFAEANPDLDLGVSELDNLVRSLEAEAPPAVVNSLSMTENLWQDSSIKQDGPVKPGLTPPSPPVSSSDPQFDLPGTTTSHKVDHVGSRRPKPLTPRERELLLRLQETIARRLGDST